MPRQPLPLVPSVSPLQRGGASRRPEMGLWGQADVRQLGERTGSGPSGSPRPARPPGQTAAGSAEEQPRRGVPFRRAARPVSRCRLSLPRSRGPIVRTFGRIAPKPHFFTTCVRTCGQPCDILSGLGLPFCQVVISRARSAIAAVRLDRSAREGTATCRNVW